MLSLLSRVVTLFSMKTRRHFFILAGIILALAYLYPNLIEPGVAKLTIGARINQLTTLNAIDRAKLKEPALKESYARILGDVGKRLSVFEVEARKKDVKFLDSFKREGLGNFLVASSLWGLLGLIALLAQDAKIGHKLGAFFAFLVLGLGAGLLAGLLPIIKPFSLFVILVVGVELLLLSFVGTMLRSLED
jgi:hypothetical protein